MIVKILFFIAFPHLSFNNFEHNIVLTIYHFFVAMHIYYQIYNMIVVQEVLQMAFQLKPNKKETENKTIRFPLPLIERIDKALENQDVTFSSFVLQACEYALDSMENTKEDS